MTRSALPPVTEIACFGGRDGASYIFQVLKRKAGPLAGTFNEDGQNAESGPRQATSPGDGRTRESQAAL